MPPNSDLMGGCLCSAIAYGDQGQGPIPGKSVLEFEVELVEISKAK